MPTTKKNPTKQFTKGNAKKPDTAAKAATGSPKAQESANTVTNPKPKPKCNTAQTAPDNPTPKRRGPKKGSDQLSGLDAAAKVLGESSEPMNCKQIIEAAFAKGYWMSDGKTPSATIYSAMLREITKKGKEARFAKVDRGRFTLSAANKQEVKK